MRQHGDEIVFLFIGSGQSCRLVAHALLIHPQRLFHLLALGDVSADAGHAIGLAMHIGEDLALAFDPARLTVGGDDAIFHVIITLAGNSGADRGKYDFDVGGMDILQQAVERAGERARPAAMESLEDVRPYHRDGSHVPIPRPYFGRGEDEAHLLVASPRRFLAAPALGYVTLDGRNRHYRTAAVANR